MDDYEGCPNLTLKLDTLEECQAKTDAQFTRTDTRLEKMFAEVRTL